MIPAPLAALLAGTARPGHAVVAWRDGEALTWDRLRGDVGALAARLDGERVALRSEDGYAFCVGLLAAAAASCPVLLLPPGAPALIASLAPHWDRLLGDGGEPILTGAAAAPPAGFDPARATVTFLTSGSTGQPKRIGRSLARLEAEVAAVAALAGPLGPGCHRATVPHHHAYGLIFKLLWPLLAGRPFAARSYPLWEPLLAELHDGDVLVSGPAHLARLDGLASARRPDLILSAGAPLPTAAASAAARLFGRAVSEILGSTETGAIAHRPGGGTMAWLPLPGAEIDHDRDGLLLVTAPWLDGQARGADRIVPALAGGFHLVGRADRVVKIEGARVGLAGVEAALAALPEIDEAAVVVLPEGGTTLAAAVVLSEPGRRRLADDGAFRLGRALRNRLAERLEPAARPRRWRFVPSLPVNALGKRTNAAVMALFPSGSADA